jgi:hypothetical protein
MGIEVTSNGHKLLFIGTYKTPNMSENAFRDDFSRTLDRIISRYDYYIIIGDLNINMLDK